MREKELISQRVPSLSLHPQHLVLYISTKITWLDLMVTHTDKCVLFFHRSSRNNFPVYDRWSLSLFSFIFSVHLKIFSHILTFLGE